MMKRLMSLCTVMALMLCGAATAEESGIELCAAQAVFTSGKGVSPENKKVATTFVESLGISQEEF